MKAGGGRPMISKRLSAPESCSFPSCSYFKTTLRTISNIWRVFSLFTNHIRGTILFNSHSCSSQYSPREVASSGSRGVEPSGTWGLKLALLEHPDPAMPEAKPPPPSGLLVVRANEYLLLECEPV